MAQWYPNQVLPTGPTLASALSQARPVPYKYYNAAKVAKARVSWFARQSSPSRYASTDDIYGAPFNYSDHPDIYPPGPPPPGWPVDIPDLSQGPPPYNWFNEPVQVGWTYDDPGTGPGRVQLVAPGGPRGGFAPDLGFPPAYSPFRFDAWAPGRVEPFESPDVGSLPYYLNPRDVPSEGVVPPRFVPQEGAGGGSGGPPWMDPNWSIPLEPVEVAEGAAVLTSMYGEVVPLLMRVLPGLGIAALAWMLLEWWSQHIVNGLNSTGVGDPGGWQEIASVPMQAGYTAGQIEGSRLTGSVYAPFTALVGSTYSTTILGTVFPPPVEAQYPGHDNLLYANWSPVTHLSQYQSHWFHPSVSPSAQPFQVGRTYPLGAPVSPWLLPTLFPLFVPQVGVFPDEIPFDSIPEFDRLAQTDEVPQIQRQVGPGPGTAPWQVPDPDVSPRYPDVPGPLGLPDVQPSVGPRPGDVYDPTTGLWVPPVIAPYMPPDTIWSPFGPLALPQPWTDVDIDTSGTAPPLFSDTPPSDLYQPPFLPRGDYNPWINPNWYLRRTARRRKAKEKKLRGSTHALRMLLMAATYGGGTLRNLWKSLPKNCKSKSRSGRRTYSSMANDIYSCFSQVDWGKFAVYETESLVKYAAEGWALSQINRNPLLASGYGAATRLYHAYGPDTGPYSSYGSGVGGAFAGRQDPFSILTHGINVANRFVGL